MGTYKGSYEINTIRGQQQGVTLIIAAVEDGKLRGTGSYSFGSCAGEYPVEGSVKGNEVGLRATAKGGRAGDCSFGFKGSINGNQLVGTMGKYEVVLRK